MKIPFLNLKEAYLDQEAEINQTILNTLNSGRYILGEQGGLFESRFKSYLVNKEKGYVVGCNSGTDALILSLKCAAIGYNDEVITVANTAIPTISAICSVGAIPVFCEIDPTTWLIAPQELEKHITSKTKAILPVHLYGNMANMTAIIQVAEKFNLKIIEDVAQAAGSTYNGKQAGTLGHFGCFSFYPSKNLGALGDGGAVFCKNEKDYHNLLALRNYGQSNRYNANIELGINSRLDEIQAAVLLVKLKNFKILKSRKQLLIDVYRNRLSQGTLPIQIQRIEDEVNPYWHLMVIKLDEGVKREALIRHLDQNKIQTLIHYPIPAHLQKAFEKYSRGILPITESYCNSILSLPMNTNLSIDQIDYVCTAVENFF